MTQWKQILKNCKHEQRATDTMHSSIECDRKVVTLDELDRLFKIKLFKQKKNRDQRQIEAKDIDNIHNKKSKLDTVRVSKSEFESIKSEMMMHSGKQLPKVPQVGTFANVSQKTNNLESTYDTETVEGHLSATKNTYLNDTEPFSEMSVEGKNDGVVTHKLSSSNFEETLNQSNQQLLLSSSLYTTNTFVNSNIDFLHKESEKNEQDTKKLEQFGENAMLLSSTGVNTSYYITSDLKKMDGQPELQYIANNPYKKTKIDYENNFCQLKDSSPPFHQAKELQELNVDPLCSSPCSSSKSFSSLIQFF